MHYALLIYEDESFWQTTPPEKMAEIVAGYQRPLPRAKAMPPATR
jgi:hypothetical protein